MLLGDMMKDTLLLNNKILKIIKNVLIFVFLFVFFLYKELIYLIPLTLLKIDYRGNYVLQTAGSLVSYLVLILVIVLIYRKYLIQKFKDFKKNFNKYFDLGLKLWFLGVVGMFICNTLIIKLTPVGEANNEILVQEMLKQAPILTLISAGIVGPFGEEMMFRKSLGDIFGNTKLMVFISGLFFGLLHVVFSFETALDFLYVIPYGLLGAAFAYMLYKTDNIFISITFHTIHNTALTLLSILTLVM